MCKRRVAGEQLLERLDSAALEFNFNQEVLAYLKAEQARGRPLVLVAATPARMAQVVASRANLSGEVLVVDQSGVARGQPWLDAVVDRFGKRGFDYMGGERDDLPVWACARRALVVAPANSWITREAAREAPIERVFPAPGTSLATVLQAMRLHQWAKNTLVFVPLLAAHRFTDLGSIGPALLAFLTMGLVASAGYLVNDLLDLHTDRRHPRKGARPFAAGALPVSSGPSLILGLLAAGIGAAALVSKGLVVWVLIYLAATLTYSLWLKQKVLVDVFLLAGLYTHRIIAGAIATSVEPSFWLLAFSMFFFLSLAMLKRYSELVELPRDSGRAGARGYRVEDLSTLGNLGAASGFSSVLVLALYMESANVKVLYRTPELFWLICPLLLYWLSRMWIGAGRGAVDDDPLIFAFRDRLSVLILGTIAGLAALAAMVDFHAAGLLRMWAA